MDRDTGSSSPGRHVLRSVPLKVTSSPTIVRVEARTGLPQAPTTNREGVQPYTSAENWIKDLLSLTLPTRADPVFPTASPSHQEAYTSLLSSSIIGQTEETRTKSHSLQNKNQNYRKLTNITTWITQPCVTQ